MPLAPFGPQQLDRRALGQRLMSQLVPQLQAFRHQQSMARSPMGAQPRPAMPLPGGSGMQSAPSQPTIPAGALPSRGLPGASSAVMQPSAPGGLSAGLGASPPRPQAPPPRPQAPAPRPQAPPAAQPVAQPRPQAPMAPQPQPIVSRTAYDDSGQGSAPADITAFIRWLATMGQGEANGAGGLGGGAASAGAAGHAGGGGGGGGYFG